MSITQTTTYATTNTAGGASISGSVVDVGATVLSIDQNFGASVVNQSLALAVTIANLQNLYLIADKGCTIRTNGTAVNEVQSVAITGTPTGGTFALGFKGQITAPIAYNAAASAVQTALQALAAIGAGGVTCSGGPLPGSAVACTFAGPLAATNVPLITASGGGLTGGTSPAVATSVTTPGAPADVIVLQPGIPLAWSLSGSYFACPFSADVAVLYISTTAATRLQGRILTN